MLGARGAGVWVAGRTLLWNAPISGACTGDWEGTVLQVRQRALVINSDHCQIADPARLWREHLLDSWHGFAFFPEVLCILSLQPSQGLEAQCVQNSGASLGGVQLLFWLLPTMHLEDASYWWYLLQ